MSDKKETRENWHTSPQVKTLVGMLASDDVKHDPVSQPNRSVTMRGLVLREARARFGNDVVDQVLKTEVSAS